MNTPFEKDWKQTLEGATPEEVVPAFDEAAGWDAVQARLSTRTRKARTKRWGLFIAAVLLLAVVGWMVWRTGNEVRPVTNEIRRSVSRTASRSYSRPAERAAVVAVKDSSLPKPTFSAPMVKRSASPGDLPQPAAQRAKDTTAQSVAPALPHTGDTTVRDEAPAPNVPSKKESPPKQPAVIVLHLMDVDGGMRQQLSPVVAQKPSRRPSLLSRLLSPAKVPDLSGQAAADAVVMRPILSR